MLELSGFSMTTRTYVGSAVRAALLASLGVTAACRVSSDAHARRDAEGQISVSVATDRADGGIRATPNANQGAAARVPIPASAAPIDAVGTVYPSDVAPHPLATRLCEVLHAVPARRKAECCGTEPAPFLMAECTRVLGATLNAGTAELDDAAVDRCAAAMTEARAGCDWVTPNAPSAPEACQRLLRGKLERGSVCRSSLECTGDLHCEGVSPTKTGVCTPSGGEGSGCGTHVDVLATYLLDRHLATSHPFCAAHCSLVTHKCGPLPEEGAACVANVNCSASQQCVQRRCSSAPPSHQGESCSASPCAEGLRCVDGACALLAKSGETCRSDIDCAEGACVRGADGHSACGAQCSPSLDALHPRAGGPIMGLPKKPRAENSKR
jgi:hypothetical protein